MKDSPMIDTSDEACALVCMIVSNPQGQMRGDRDGWQQRVNDLIRALRDERNRLREELHFCNGTCDLAMKHRDIAEADARRYRRLQILGCAPDGSRNLDAGTVLRFTNLDAFVDADLHLHPSRGEALQSTPNHKLCS